MSNIRRVITTAGMSATLFAGSTGCFGSPEAGPESAPATSEAKPTTTEQPGLWIRNDTQKTRGVARSLQIHDKPGLPEQEYSDSVSAEDPTSPRKWLGPNAGALVLCLVRAPIGQVQQEQVGVKMDFDGGLGYLYIIDQHPVDPDSIKVPGNFDVTYDELSSLRDCRPEEAIGLSKQ